MKNISACFICIFPVKERSRVRCKLDGAVFFIGFQEIRVIFSGLERF